MLRSQEPAGSRLPGVPGRVLHTLEAITQTPVRRLRDKIIAKFKGPAPALFLFLNLPKSPAQHLLQSIQSAAFTSRMIRGQPASSTDHFAMAGIPAGGTHGCDANGSPSSISSGKPLISRPGQGSSGPCPRLSAQKSIIIRRVNGRDPSVRSR